MPCFNPYKNFRFRVKWDGRYGAAVSEISGLELAREVVTPCKPCKEAASSSLKKLPQRTKFKALQLMRGVSYDKEFQQWAQNVLNRGSGSGLFLKDFRKDLIIEMYNEADQLAITYKVYKSWVSKYLAMPALGGNSKEVIIESISLENGGWERHDEVT